MKPDSKQYRIESTRLEGYDYGSNGAYFVTICTAHRKHFLGSVLDTDIQRSEWNERWKKFDNGALNAMQDLVVLSPIGKLAEQYWLDIPKHFPWVILDQFIVMPNHLHGILFFQKQDEMQNVTFQQEGQDFLKTQNIASLRGRDSGLDFFSGLTGHQNSFGPQSANLASVMRGYKAGVKAHCTKNSMGLGWQPRFYDRIIRDEKELNEIREYVFANPMNWALDKDNTESLLM